ncbi:glycosyltransferase [Candidatus Saccharibacteria bacterium]|nr:glycosyltransferase [Candidatus Saccharibacteria bacterium]
MQSKTNPRVAIVHDWLTNLGGAERVVEAMIKAFPQADIYTSVYNRAHVPIMQDVSIKTSFLQHWPLARRYHQLFPILRRYAFEQFDFSEYDVVISSSSAEAKGLITSESCLHISYIHTPTRYYWSHYNEYLDNPGFGLLNPVVRWQLRRSINQSRRWDFAAAQRPDVLLANSGAVAQRIKRFYDRESQVVYPNVDTDRFSVQKLPRPDGAPNRYALVVSRLIPYKRIDIAVQAARRAQMPLVVIGRGSELKRLKAMAGPDTVFLGALKDAEVTAYMQHAEVFLFPGEEDFGITPVEAMSAGVPVIAYKKGGAVETVIDNVTGVLVEHQTAEAFTKVLSGWTKYQFSSKELQEYAEKFTTQRFIDQLHTIVQQSLKNKTKVCGDKY